MKRKLSAMLLAVLLLQTVSCAESSENTEAAADTRTTSFSFAYGLQYNNILGDLKGNDTGVGSYYQSKLKAADRLLEKTLADFEKIKENRG